MENRDDDDEIQDPHAASAQAFSSVWNRRRNSSIQSPLKNDHFQEDEEFNPLAGNKKVSTESCYAPSMSLDSTGRNDKLFSLEKIFTEPQTYDPSNKLDMDSVIKYFENASRSRKPSKPPQEFTPRFTFYSEKTGIIRSSFFKTLDLNVDGSSVRETLTAAPFWIDVCSPTPFEMNEISKLFGLHPLTNEDIQTPDTREKCEVFSKYFFVVIRTFDQDQFKNTFLQPISFYIVIFEECILSVYICSH